MATAGEKAPKTATGKSPAAAALLGKTTPLAPEATPELDKSSHINELAG